MRRALGPPRPARAAPRALGGAVWLGAWLLFAGCAGAPPAAPSLAAPSLAAPHRIDAEEGYSLTFPAPVETRTGREGRFLFRIDAARTPDGARFEAAWFGFPQAFDAEDRAALLDRVERGLAAEPGTRPVSRARSRTNERDAIDLVLERPDGKRGYHRVLYPSPREMLQVSAVGPRRGGWEGALPSFWESLKLSPPGAADSLVGGGQRGARAPGGLELCGVGGVVRGGERGDAAGGAPADLSLPVGE